MMCLSVMMKYDIVQTDTGPMVRAYRVMGYEGTAAQVEERLYLERRAGFLDKEDRDLEELFGRVGLFR
jgi:hypothetical protein